MNQLYRSQMALTLLVRRPSEAVVRHSTASEGRRTCFAKVPSPTASGRAYQFALLWLVLAAASAHANAQDDDIAALEEQSMNAAVANVADSVVRIETVGGLDRIEEVLLGDGPTTGLIVDADGFIVSSAFNFLSKPSSILVTLPSGKRTPAEIVARDHSRMLVLLKVTTEEALRVPTAVPVDQMQVGQWAIAVGRALDSHHPNMSVGIISAKDRVWGKAIQCDAKISPSNYGGPLVDIQGRVLGVLVPMSPNETSEVAGAEWYDSGIGFAVPLADVNRSLDKMKKGEDVFPGMLGIALKGGSIYSLPADIAACQVKSPAYEAGVRAGDTIIEIDGHPIQRQAHLKHALGPRYAGDTVHVVLKRDEQRIETDVTLVDQLVPYEHPFLGILPLRDRKSIVVRYVFPESGAAAAGIQIGDKITKVNDAATPTLASLRETLASLEPKQIAQVTLVRDEKEETVQVALSSLPTTIPDNLPPPRQQTPNGDVPPADFIEVKIPEHANACLAFVPPSYQADVPHGVVVYLRPPGEFDKQGLLDRWRTLCEANDLILLAPQPLDANRWTPVEVEFVQKTLEQTIANYNIDKSRIAMHGQEAGGALAYLFAFRNRELARAVVVVDAATPARLRVPDNDPVYPLAILTTLAPGAQVTERVKQTVDQLRKMKYPVTVLPLDTTRDLNEQERGQVVRWIDTLDRI
ncbi:MAG: PDZ domain-containing protein [Planctomycetaceae bacterium]|nr:PDZ domain-containing protein [Planctomycetales bacterium]MCB9939540.1 PDZ domain-containing protein [Planctomycetaceae bacterium]